MNKYDAGGWSFQVASNNELDWFVDPNTTNLTDPGPQSVTLGQWTFVTVVWQNPNTGFNQVSYYINGLLDPALGTGGAKEISSGSAPLEVGTVSGAYNFDGSLHDVAVYNRALSSPEVAVNFLVTEFDTNVPKPDLLYYKMTEYGQATPPVLLADSSTHGGTTGTVWDTNNHSLSLPLWTNNPGGVTNSAIHFHGLTSGQPQTEITTGNTNLFNFTTNSFTINVWLRPDNEGSFYLGNDTFLTNGWYLAGLATNSALIFGAETNGDNAITTINGVNGWPITSWNMVTITYDGTNNPLIYINGLVVPTTGTFVNPASSGNSLIFGLGVGPYGLNDLDGDIWLPQIWSKVLSPMDIANLYCNQLFGIRWP